MEKIADTSFIKHKKQAASWETKPGSKSTAY